MNCDQCQEQISLFIDGELEAKTSADVQIHLAVCAECAELFEDFAEIVGLCTEKRAEEASLPNSQALWCRISNVIETEARAELEKPAPVPQAKRGLFGRLWNYTWQLSGAQMVSSILGIALVSSLLTVVGIKNAESDGNVPRAHSASPSMFQAALSRVGLAETAQQARERQIRERQATIEYWNQRVESRRAQWDKQLREAFDRNVSEIDQVVFEYKRVLQQNPQDDLTGEMLDSALTEKMELLREFSEL